LCIPASLFAGLIFGAFATFGGANATESVCCITGIPVILFILGLVILIKGMEGPGHSTSKHEERFCPNCGRVIPFDARKCPYCSKKFEDY